MTSEEFLCQQKRYNKNTLIFQELITLEDIEHFRHIKIILGQPFFVIFLELTEDGTKSDFKAMYNYARQWKLVLFYRSLEYTLIFQELITLEDLKYFRQIKII